MGVAAEEGILVTGNTLYSCDGCFSSIRKSMDIDVGRLL